MEKTMSATTIETDYDYYALEKIIAQRVAGAAGPLFTTDASGLFDGYLAGILAEHRQHYNCRACERFIEKYGSLATIAADGKLSSLLWNDAPVFFMQSVGAMANLVRRAKVTGVFLSSEKVWGHPHTGAWTHLAGVPASVHAHPLQSASQVMAEKREDYRTLCHGLSDFPLEAVVQAVRVLEAGAVDRSEKTLGVAQWLLALHTELTGVRGPMRNNLIWLAVATAPQGWCHIRSKMISTLLDDVVAGLLFEVIKSRWDAKMHPLQYQRPTTVKEGAIEQANQIVAKLQSEGALQRRFAKLTDVTALWLPREAPARDASKGGAFDHLKEKSTIIREVDLPEVGMTWEKFHATVLPGALSVEVYLRGGVRLPLYGLVTAVDADAPPILQWDGLDGHARNPVSWYLYVKGSPVHNWSLAPGWSKVSAIFHKPCYWQQPHKFTHQGKGVLFALAGAKDATYNRGAGFFPETLRSEYHGIRSVMEAYAKDAALAGIDEGNANGIVLGESSPLNVRVTGVHTTRYLVSL